LIARQLKPFAIAFNRESQEMLGGARMFDVEISEKSLYLQPIRETNWDTYQPAVESLNREIFDRASHCLAKFIVVHELPYGMSLEVGHRQRIRQF
jgi:hypothetical protein